MEIRPNQPTGPTIRLAGGGGINPDGSIDPTAVCAHCYKPKSACTCGGAVQSRMNRDNYTPTRGQQSQAQLPGTQSQQPAGSHTSGQTGAGGQRGNGSGSGGTGNSRWKCTNPRCKGHYNIQAVADKLTPYQQTKHRLEELRGVFTSFKAWTSKFPFRIPLVEQVENLLRVAETSFAKATNHAGLQKIMSALDHVEERMGDLADWTKKIDNAPGKLKGLLGKKGVKMVRSMALPPWAQPFIKAWEAGSTAGEVVGEAAVLFDEAAALALRFKNLEALFAL